MHLNLIVLFMSQGCSRKKGIGVELKSIKIRLVGGVSLDIHMDCTIKKDKIVFVEPPFSSSVPTPNTFFTWNCTDDFYLSLALCKCFKYIFLLIFFLSRLFMGSFVNLAFLPLCTEPWNDRSCKSSVFFPSLVESGKRTRSQSVPVFPNFAIGPFPMTLI